MKKFNVLVAYRFRRKPFSQEFQTPAESAEDAVKVIRAYCRKFRLSQPTFSATLSIN